MPRPVPFLTDLDSRAAIKGSRDPLGLVPVWSRLGRGVVGNLTTVSNSVRGFTTLLLGHYFAEAVHERPGGRDQSTLELFLKFEQLAAYVRYHVNKDGEFRGHDRVLARLAKGPKVTLGADTTDQILGNQKVYGLWGLFSVPARASGLLEPDETVLTPVAREFVERQYIRRLAADGFKDGRAIIDLLRRKRADVFLAGRDSRLAESLARILAPKVSAAEQEFYDRHLVDGGPEDRTQGRQPLLADLLGHLPADTAFSMPELRETTRRASRVPGGEPLAERLEAIGKVEQLLVPMESVFGFLQSRDRQPVVAVADEVRRAWGRSLRHVDPTAIAAVRPTIAEAFQDSRAADRFVLTAEAFTAGDYGEAIQFLIDHNAFVMQARNGSQPWVRLEGGKLDVRYRDESGWLLPAEELPDYWRSTYFINSLKRVVTTLSAA